MVKVHRRRLTHNRYFHFPIRLAAMAALLGPVTAAASAVYQPLPFNQNWTNTTLLIANDDWSGVPGIVGYLGEDPISSEAGRLPRTITADSSTTSGGTSRRAPASPDSDHRP